MEENSTLLIVDDEPEILMGYRAYLNPSSSSSGRKPQKPKGAPTENYNLLIANSGEKAVELFKAELAAGRKVAAGFFDLRLAGKMDGVTVIRTIRELDKEIRCVVVTGFDDHNVEEISAIFGEEYKDYWDYLDKPFTQREIVQKARQMVAAWNRKRHLEMLHSQLIRAERLAAVGQVARGIGHEFGNLLLRIVGKTDLALMEKDPTRIHDHLKVAMTAAERASVIVRNLQSVSKTEPTFQESEITVPLDEAVTLVNHELNQYRITVEKSYQPVPRVQIDVGAMGQVFLNLLINAKHAMPKGGKILISVQEAASPDGISGVAVRVKDTGVGIPPEVLPRIFDFAFTTKGDRGSGLGLSVSKEIVEAHGGKILVETEVGKGTEFTVWLPRKRVNGGA